MIIIRSLIYIAGCYMAEFLNNILLDSFVQRNNFLQRYKVISLSVEYRGQNFTTIAFLVPLPTT